MLVTRSRLGRPCRHLLPRARCSNLCCGRLSRATGTIFVVRESRALSRRIRRCRRLELEVDQRVSSRDAARRYAALCRKGLLEHWFQHRPASVHCGVGLPNRGGGDLGAVSLISSQSGKLVYDEGAEVLDWKPNAFRTRTRWPVELGSRPDARGSDERRARSGRPARSEDGHFAPRWDAVPELGGAAEDAPRVPAERPGD